MNNPVENGGDEAALRKEIEANLDGLILSAFKINEREMPKAPSKPPGKVEPVTFDEDRTGVKKDHTQTHASLKDKRLAGGSESDEEASGEQSPVRPATANERTEDGKAGEVPTMTGPLLRALDAEDDEDELDPEEEKYADVDIIKMIEETPMSTGNDSGPPPAEQPRIQPLRSTNRRAVPRLPPNLYPDHPKYSGRIRDFRLGELVGSGNFTQIFEAEERANGKKVAIKVAAKARLLQLNKVEDLKVEKHCLGKLKGVPQVVQMLETTQDFDNVYLIMELLEGPELWEQCRVFGVPSRRKAALWFVELLRGVVEMHRRGIVHRDLKPENVRLIASEGQGLKLFDFGTAKDEVENVEGRGNSSTGKKFYKNFIGTAQYMAPECVHDKCSPQASDIYSLGCLYYHLLVGFPPYLGGSDYLVFKAAEEFKPLFYPEIFSDEDKKLIEGCLAIEYKDRPTSEQLLKSMEDRLDNWDSAVKEASPFIQKLEEAVKKIKSEPTNGKTKEDVKNAVEALRLVEANEPRLKLFARQLKHHWNIKVFEHKGQPKRETPQ